MCCVRPYVVFDGGYDPDDRKLPTILERMKKRMLSAKTMSRSGHGNVMPILAQETFLQVLTELGVPYVSCQYEADREIAVLANRFGCPVMSNDSDFFVFGLEGGFMPFDYVNLTLCVCNSKTEKKSVMELSRPLEEDEYVYIPVKLYKQSRFVKQYRQSMEKYILPVFATVLGNDYIDSKRLEGFYAQLHIPKKNNQKFSVPKLNTRMLAVLKWLDSVKDVDRAIQSVLIHLPKDKREDIGKQLLTSIHGYSDLENFADFDLQKFLESFEGNNNPSHMIFPELKDFYSNVLPEWFVIGSRKCEIAGILQNMAVLHRTIRLCQVETISEPSTYTCCKNITEVISGLIFGGDINQQVTDTSRQAYLVEYDRDHLNIKKSPVKPATSVQSFSPLPTLHTLTELPNKVKFKLLLCTLGLSEEFVEAQDSLQPFSLLLVALLCQWVRNADPKVTVHHLYSVVICVLTLHARSLRWLEQKQAKGGKAVIPYLAAEIRTSYETATPKQKEKFLNSVDKFFKTPDHSTKNPRENALIHGFSQFQACLYETVHLNQLLMRPVEPPSPSLILNSTFVYNLCRDLQNRTQPDLYVAELLSPNSPFHELFSMIQGTVMDVCGREAFKVSGAVVLTKRSKGKGRKGKQKDQAQVVSDSEDADREEVVVNCDTSNMFALLNLDD